MSGTWDAWLAAEAAAREAAGLARRLHPREATGPVLDLAGNDYLGLTRHPRVTAAAAGAAVRWGAGAGASRLVTGTLGLHGDLEAALARLTGWPAALAFSTGYHANLSVVGALADRDSVVVSDAHNHASLIDACRLSRATVVVTPHGEVDAVEDAMRRARARRGSRLLVLTESVFSVLGDAAPLADLARVYSTYDALLVVDEAHGVGVAGLGGRGLVHAVGLAGDPGVVVTATLSKALGSQGGAVLASPTVIEHLVNRARPFIYDTGLAPPAAAAARAAIDVLTEQPERPRLVAERAYKLAAQLDVRTPAGAVLSVPMPSPLAALAAQAAALERGVRVGCFRPPSVPDGVSRLRVTTSAGPCDEDWARAVAVVADVAAMAGGAR